MLGSMGCEAVDVVVVVGNRRAEVGIGGSLLSPTLWVFLLCDGKMVLRPCLAEIVKDILIEHPIGKGIIVMKFN